VEVLSLLKKRLKTLLLKGILMKYILIFFIFFFQSCSEPAQNLNSTTKIIFIHGFDGGTTEKESKFDDDIREVFMEYAMFNPDVEFYQWDSKGRILTKGVLPQIIKDTVTFPLRWKKAKIYAKKHEAKNFLNYIEKLEDKKQPYYIIGYSLGTKVIVEALNLRKDKFNMLKGIYFIGAAIPESTKINTKILPNNFKIINFYSPKYDQVLKKIYNIAENPSAFLGFGDRAGGEKGFKDENIFKNFKTNSSHLNIDDCGFMNMGYSIGYLIAMNEKLNIKSSDCKISHNNSIKDRWNDLIYDSHSDTIYQQNSCSESKRYFRIVEDSLFSFKEKKKNCNLVLLAN
jgi:hypothetical protein